MNGRRAKQLRKLANLHYNQNQEEVYSVGVIHKKRLFGRNRAVRGTHRWMPGSWRYTYKQLKKAYRQKRLRNLLYHTRETLSVGSYGAQGAILEAGGIERRNNMGVLKAIGLMVVFISVAVVVTFVLIEIVGVNREICRYIGMVLGIGGGVAAASISINRDWI